MFLPLENSIRDTLDTRASMSTRDILLLLFDRHAYYVLFSGVLCWWVYRV